MEIIRVQLRTALERITDLIECQKQREYQVLFCLFFEKKDTSKECWQTCQSIKFRLAWESNSPAFFGEFLKISQAERRLHNYLAVECEGVSKEQFEETQAELWELGSFVESVISTLYPLFLANGEEFPFLSSEKIRQEREIFLKEGIGQIVERMKELNSEWYAQVSRESTSLSHQWYANETIFLVKLFLEGIEKEQENLFKKIEELYTREAR